jgi:hypothetical protein
MIQRDAYRRPAWASLLGFAALGCGLVAGPASAIDLEADLSSHYIEIRTTFKGAAITVFGSVTGDNEKEAREILSGADVIVIVRGPPQTLDIRRKEELGPIWANRTSYIARNVPSFYYVASTRPVGTIVDDSSLKRYEIGFNHVNIEFAKATNQTGAAEEEAASAGSEPASASVASFDDLLTIDERASEEESAALPEPLSVPAAPGQEEGTAFRTALIELLKQRLTFSEDGRLSIIRSHLFRTEVYIPSTVPAGAYNAEIYLVKDRVVRDAESMSFFIDKKGIERDISTLAHKHPIVHGFLAVLLAVAAGWISEAALRRR